MHLYLGPVSLDVSSLWSLFFSGTIFPFPFLKLRPILRSIQERKHVCLSVFPEIVSEGLFKFILTHLRTVLLNWSREQPKSELFYACTSMYSYLGQPYLNKVLFFIKLLATTNSHFLQRFKLVRSWRSGFLFLLLLDRQSLFLSVFNCI